MSVRTPLSLRPVVARPINWNKLVPMNSENKPTRAEVEAAVKTILRWTVTIRRATA